MEGEWRGRGEGRGGAGDHGLFVVALDLAPFFWSCFFKGFFHLELQLRLHKSAQECTCTIYHQRHFGRAASGGALAPEPPRATRIQPEPGRTAAEGFSPTSHRAHWIGPES